MATPLHIRLHINVFHSIIIAGKSEKDSSDSNLPRWTQRILVNDLHGDARGRGGGGGVDLELRGIGGGGGGLKGARGQADGDGGQTPSEIARDNFVTRRSKTDMTHMSSNNAGLSRSRLPIFVSNENARMWLDLGKQGKKKSNSLDALDNDHHYVNVAPPRPPKFRLEPPRISTPVYVNVYSLGRRKPGDVIRSGR